VVVEKGVLCWHGASSDGRRKVGGICWDLLDLSSRLRAGRIAVEVGIIATSDQLRMLTSHVQTRELEIFRDVLS
jgi:hypothetical protein